MLGQKHAEIGAAMGIGQAAMDRGIGEGLSRRRAQPGFLVDVVGRDELSLAWSPDRRFARALRNDGRDAILLSSEGEWQGFDVTMGFDQGKWIVIR